MNERNLERVLRGTQVVEGAGVKLRRVFEHAEAKRLDPFLMFDDFGSTDPKDYVAGFPWHPHRGIETVTLMLSGKTEHGDSIGNHGVIGPGDMQWMTAGSGIIHQEMPLFDPVRLRGFQLWVNLPRSHKMMTPRYRGITAADMPVVTAEDGVRVTVISGECRGTRGIVSDIVVPVLYLVLDLPAGTSFTETVPAHFTVCVYCYGGSIAMGDTTLSDGQLGLLGSGDRVTLAAGSATTRCLLLAGQPLREPIAWRGPIVMNTEAELDLAFHEYRNGTFIKD